MGTANANKGKTGYRFNARETMKKAEIKDRISKVDDRIPVLIKKYPFVFTTVLLGGALIGFVVGLLA